MGASFKHTSPKITTFVYLIWVISLRKLLCGVLRWESINSLHPALNLLNYSMKLHVKMHAWDESNQICSIGFRAHFIGRPHS